ncbi:LuxR family transcriptional regulator [Actinoplanes sp. DH11]|uniref:helix-turn-helix transcriptional regulator n=1 Tax=Actinoplanes sp. DH11 TaxID=2857011 RepID=UPI001E602AD4|nr:LuxR family transcriptional regulator [Actinoplanes sp. DH11]
MDIVGRESELATLYAMIDRRPGTPSNLTLHGDPGIGKTVLLQAGIRYAEERGIRVIGGTGFESEAKLAFAGLYQLFGHLPSYLDRLEPFHRSVLRRVLGLDDGPPPDRLAVCTASLAALSAIAADGPVLIAVEDAHWVDVPTREVMMFLLLRMSTIDVRAIFARRPLVASERVTPGIGMLEIPPLEPLAAAELLDLLHPDLPAPARERILRDAAGNPLALADLPHAFGTNAAVGLEMLPAAAPLRTRLEAGYAGRVTTLPAPTRTALLVSALDGDPLDRTADAAHPSVLSLDDIAAVERLGLITRDSTPTRLTFRHPLVRSAIVNTAAPDEIRAAHLHLAQQYRGNPELRVWHLAAATIEPDEAIAQEIERGAALISSRGGTGLAVAAMQRAAALSPSPDDAARRLHDGAELASASGQLDLAQRLLDEARHHTDDPSRSARALTVRAEVLLRRDGDLAAADQLLDRAIRQTSEPAGRARATKLLLMSAFYSADHDRWAHCAALMQHCDDEELHLTFAVLGGLTAGGETLRHQLTAAFDDLPLDAPPGRVVDLCRAAMAVDGLRERRTWLRGLVERESGTGAVTHAVAGHLLSAHDHFLAGDWEASEKAADVGMDLAVRHGLEPAVNDLRCHLGWLAAARGDVETVHEYSRTIERWAGPRSSRAHLAQSTRNLALAALTDGDYEAAYEHATTLVRPGHLPGFAHAALWATLDLIEAATRINRIDEARAHLAAAEAAGLADLTPRLRLHIYAARAMLSQEDPVGLYRQALALPGVERWPFEHARIRLALGEHYRRHQQPGAARPELRRATDLFARLGATIWSRRAEQELRATGIAITGAGGPTRTDSQSIDLTAQQLEVAHLAAAGLSNKEIGQRLYLSPRTVGAHLYRIFPKLGITSRSALRDALDKLT